LSDANSIFINDININDKFNWEDKMIV